MAGRRVPSPWSRTARRAAGRRSGPPAWRRWASAVAFAPGAGRLAELVRAGGAGRAQPWRPRGAPGLPAGRRGRRPVLSEIELAATAAAELGPTLVAVTGTNGKTTVTTLIAEMLRRRPAGALAAGNIGRPLIDAVHDDASTWWWPRSPRSSSASPTASGPGWPSSSTPPQDHLDWHPDFDAYVAAKAKIFANQSDDDLLVYNADDEARGRGPAPARAARPPARPDGSALDEAGSRPRRRRSQPTTSRRPHDVANALAAAAAALDLGARSAEAVALVLPVVSRGSPTGSLRWVKLGVCASSTTPRPPTPTLPWPPSPASSLSSSWPAGATRASTSASSPAEADRIRAVVAIGEAAAEVAAAFEGLRPVSPAGSMAEAVRRPPPWPSPATPSCSPRPAPSFDWYTGYAARGDDFAACVADSDRGVDGRRRLRPRQRPVAQPSRAPAGPPPRGSGGRVRAARSPPGGRAAGGPAAHLLRPARPRSSCSTWSAWSWCSRPRRSRRLANYGSSWLFFKRQLLWSVLGLVAMIAASRFDYRRLRRHVGLLLVVSAGLLLLVLVPGVGHRRQRLHPLAGRSAPCASSPPSWPSWPCSSSAPTSSPAGPP